MWITLGIIVLFGSGYSIWAFTPSLLSQKGSIESEQIIVVAHRGGAGLGLENTLSCIEEGIKAGADVIEIDIHQTIDGHLVVCHDITVDRTTDGTGRIEDMTLAELQKLHITDKNGNSTEEHLPELNEVLSLLNGRGVGLLVEVKREKGMYAGIEQKLVDEIKQYSAETWVTVQSFNDSVLENMHRISPSIRLEKLMFAKLPGLPIIFDGTFTRFSWSRYCYISSFNMFHRSARATFIENCRKRGFEVKLWTVDDPNNLPDTTIDGIITDYPNLWKNP